MRAVSAALLRTLRGSHSIIARARVCTEIQTGTDPVGTEIPILSGDVTSSSSADVRSTLTMTTLEKWPRSATDLLAPYGNEIFVERGVNHGNGQHEWVGLGYYRINDPDQDSVPDGPITLNCTDRWQGIIDGRFYTAKTFPATMTRRNFVAQLINQIYPGLSITWDDNTIADATLGKALAVDNDRAGVLKELFTALGKIGYFKYDGTFRVESPPSITGPASWLVNAGTNGVMTRMSRSISREGVFNIAIAASESADSAFPVRYVAADYGPNSPTRVDGRFGPVPGPVFSSPMIQTTAQARTAAEALLKRSLGLPYVVRLGSIVNPGLEPYDVIDVGYPERSRGRTLVIEKHVCDQVKIPLTMDGEQTIDTRQQPVILIGELS